MCEIRLPREKLKRQMKINKENVKLKILHSPPKMWGHILYTIDKDFKHSHVADQLGVDGPLLIRNRGTVG